MDNPYYCCCCCSIYWPDVSVAYWPGSQSNTQCLNEIGTNTAAFQAALEAYFNTGDPMTAVNTGYLTNAPGYDHDGKQRARQRRALQERGPPHKFFALTPEAKLHGRDGSNSIVTAVVGSFTYTSPWVYLQVPQVMAADGCGFVGQKYTSLVYSFSSQDISTIWVDDPDCWAAPLDNDQDQFRTCQWQTQSFNFDDLPCPPQSLRNAGGNEFIFASDALYAPYIAMPDAMRYMDRDWGMACEPTFGWDPFIALRPEGGLLPATTASSSPTPASASPAKALLHPILVQRPAKSQPRHSLLRPASLQDLRRSPPCPPPSSMQLQRPSRLSMH